MADSAEPLPIPQARVLVVDDEAHVRSALVRSLTLLGYRASEACSGHQALEMLAQMPYEAMVLDLRMPGMDGAEVMQRACQMWPDLCIIILTGHATLETAITAVKSHAADYLLKPASVHDVAAAITAALQKRTRELRQRYLLQVVGLALDEIRGIEASEEVPLTATPERFLCAGPITLDRQKCVLTVTWEDNAGSSNAELTISETKLLVYLMQHPGAVLSCSELARSALGYDLPGGEAQSIVRPHICRLRKKVEPDPAHPRMIRTVLGKGYLFVF